MTVTASKYARVENDLYQTEPWVTEAILRNFPMTGLLVWENAAGNHLMADVLREHGAKVITTDIATYDREHDGIFDFLNGDDFGCPSNCDFVDAIFTNPPYGKQNRDAVKFVERALRWTDGWVIMVLTNAFDSGNTRNHLFRDNHRFHAKIVLIDRISWTLDGETGTGDHAVFVWRPRNWPNTPPPKLIYEGKQ